MLSSTDQRQPETSCLLHKRLAILDLETTGTRPTHDRIIEIGLIQVSEGQVEEEWSTLVHPQTEISPFIENCTGISNQMVADAPLFEQVAGQLLKRLSGRVLVAHNARFDYGFLEQELSRIGHPFRATTLCTVQLSRKLAPGERRHGLDALIERHSLNCQNRHRALDDARALSDFLHLLPDLHSNTDLNQAVRAQLKTC